MGTIQSKTKWKNRNENKRLIDIFNPLFIVYAKAILSSIEHWMCRVSIKMVYSLFISSFNWYRLNHYYFPEGLRNWWSQTRSRFAPNNACMNLSLFQSVWQPILQFEFNLLASELKIDNDDWRLTNACLMFACLSQWKITLIAESFCYGHWSSRKFRIR